MDRAYWRGCAAEWFELFATDAWFETGEHRARSEGAGGSRGAPAGIVCRSRGPGEERARERAAQQSGVGRERTKALKKLTTLLLTFLLGATVALAQDNVSGKYEGTIKSPDEKGSLELKSEGGKISGRLQNGEKSLESSEGSLKDGMLSLTFGKDASLTARVEGDLIVGEWRSGTQKRAIEFKKVPVATATATAAPATDLSGQWEAVADANGQPFPFLLTLKVEGEKVTGSSSSQLGEAMIKEGSWKDGKLVINLENQNGVIAMSASIVEGKLSGEFDYAGQLQGRWVAVKKN